MLRCDFSKYRLELTLRDSIVSKGAQGVKNCSAGAIVVCRVPMAYKHSKWSTRLPSLWRWSGQSLAVSVSHMPPIQSIGEMLQIQPESSRCVKFGSYAMGVVMPSSIPNKSRFDISLRPSIVKAARQLANKRLNPQSTSYLCKNMTQGDVVRGYVVGVSKAGCFVRLSPTVTGRVMLKNLSDGFVTDPQEMFPVGKQLVRY